MRSRLALFVALWWAFEELMVIGCSVAYIVKPWTVEPGQAQCSALLQFDMGRVGMLIAAGLLWKAVRPITIK